MSFDLSNFRQQLMAMLAMSLDMQDRKDLETAIGAICQAEYLYNQVMSRQVLRQNQALTSTARMPWQAPDHANLQHAPYMAHPMSQVQDFMPEDPYDKAFASTSDGCASFTAVAKAIGFTLPAFMDRLLVAGYIRHDEAGRPVPGENAEKGIFFLRENYDNGMRSDYYVITYTGGRKLEQVVRATELGPENSGVLLQDRFATSQDGLVPVSSVASALCMSAGAFINRLVEEGILARGSQQLEPGPKCHAGWMAQRTSVTRDGPRNYWALSKDGVREVARLLGLNKAAAALEDVKVDAEGIDGAGYARYEGTVA